MPIRSITADQYTSFENGVDNSSPLGTPMTNGTLSIGLNIDLLSESLAKKRNGFSPPGSAWSTRRVRQGCEYQKLDGSKEVLIYGESSSITGTSGILGKFNIGSTPTTLASSLKDNIKPCLFQYRNLMFVINGTNNRIYDGTSVRQIGIDYPSSAPVYVGLTAGDLNDTGSYIFAYTYFNTTTGAESSPSDFTDAITTGSTAAQRGITINITPGNSSLADKIRVWRSTSGGKTLYLDAVLNITATSHTSTQADTLLGQELELDNGRPSDNLSFGVAFDSRIFLAGDPNNPNRVFYSKVGASGPMPESFQAADFCDCNLNDGDKVIGLASAGTVLIVLKERSVGRLIKIRGLEGGLEREGSQKYLYEEITRGVSGVNHHCMVTIDNLVLWLGRDEIYGTNGQDVRRVGKRILNTVLSLNFAQDWKFSGLNKSDTQQVIWSVCRSDTNEPDFQIVGHYTDADKFPFTFYGPGTDTTTHPGIPAASLFEVTIDRKKAWYCGSSAADGQTYRFDNGGSDNGAGIYFDLRPRWEQGRTAASHKLFHSYYLFAAGNGNNYSVTHTFEVDNVETIVATDTSSLLTEGSTTWGSPQVWAGFNWAQVRFLPLKFFPSYRGYLGRYGVQNTAADQPVAIKSILGIHQYAEIHR